MTNANPAEPLDYAIAQGVRPPGIGAVVAVLGGGFLLVLLGGCFLIGVLLLLTNQAPNNGPFSPVSSASIWSTRDTIFLSVLYGLAFVCFATGAWVIVLAIKKLLTR